MFDDLEIRLSNYIKHYTFKYCTSREIIDLIDNLSLKSHFFLLLLLLRIVGVSYSEIVKPFATFFVIYDTGQ